MRPPRGGRASALFALLAILVFAAALAILVRHAVLKNPLDPDLAALLPHSIVEGVPAEEGEAFRRHLSREGAERAVVLLVAESPTGRPLGRDEEAALDRSAAALRASLLASGVFAPSDDAAFDPARAVVPHAPGHFLTDADREFLRRADAEALARRAAQTLMRPGPLRALPYAQDPFGLYGNWLLERMRSTTLEPGGTEGVLRAAPQKPSESVRVLMLKPREGAEASGKGLLRDALDAAETSMRESAPESLQLRVAAAGVPFFTDEASERAASDLGFIGTLSSVLVMLLAWLLFGRLRTILSMAATVALGCAAAAGAAFWIFDRIALVAFVFGATLIGVAVDYSSHWYALREPGESPWARRRRIAPSLLWACGSSAAAYGALAAAPLPGLRQMALLAAAGIAGALLAVLALLPYLESREAPPHTRLMKTLESALPRLPRLTRRSASRPGVLLLAAAFALALGFGLARLEWTSGAEGFRTASPERIAAQAEASQRLGLPSPAQAYLIKGETTDAVLEREAVLRRRLADDPELQDVRAFGLASWLPDQRTAQENARLVGEAIDRAAPFFLSNLGAVPPAPDGRAPRLEDFTGTAFEAAVRAFVIEHSPERTLTVVMLSGVGPKHLAALERAARGLDGVHFANVAQAIDHSLAEYRDRVLELLGLGVVLLAALLGRFIGRNAWRALLPSVVGIIAAAAFLGLAGIPMTLFTALGCVLLLGLGVDYGIFLTARPDDGRTSAAVLFSGVTTMLSFGLLAFSSTPALSSFGLTLLVGQSTIWIASPLLRPITGWELNANSTE